MGGKTKTKMMFEARDGKEREQTETKSSKRPAAKREGEHADGMPGEGPLRLHHRILPGYTQDASVSVLHRAPTTLRRVNGDRAVPLMLIHEHSISSVRRSRQLSKLLNSQLHPSIRHERNHRASTSENKSPCFGCSRPDTDLQGP